MYQHFRFFIACGVILCVYITTCIFYLLTLTNQPDNWIIHLILKPIPVILLCIQSLIYMKLYSMHRYVSYIVLMLAFSLLGDVGLCLFSTFNKPMLFLTGMACFLFGRISLLIACMIMPYRQQRCSSSYFYKPIHVYVGIIFLALAIAVSVLYDIGIIKYDRSLILAIAVPIYIFFCFLNILAALTRIKAIPLESPIATYLCLAGCVLYGASDAVLGYAMFMLAPSLQHTSYFGYLQIPIMILYWLGLLLISWSVLRNWKSEDDELHGLTYDLMLV